MCLVMNKPILLIAVLDIEFTLCPEAFFRCTFSFILRECINRRIVKGLLHAVRKRQNDRFTVCSVSLVRVVSVVRTSGGAADEGARAGGVSVE